MDFSFDTKFDEVVMFEMPSEADAERLWLRLQPARLAWLHHRDDTYCVAAVLRAESEDLALLLRELEAWVADRGVHQVRFELDGRTYSLRGRAAAVASTV
jgi:hypothetical protein